jgi:hypothetical protein
MQILHQQTGILDRLSHARHGSPPNFRRRNYEIDWLLFPNSGENLKRSAHVWENRS